MHIDEELFKQEEFKRNLKLYEEAMKSGKTVFLDIDDMTDIIDYYNYNGQVDDANSVANYALSLYPGAIGPLVYKARKALINDDYEEAARCCEAIEDKSDIDYFYLKVELEIANNRCDEAEKMLEEAFPKMYPEDRECFLLDTGALYVDYGKSDLAEKWLNLANDKDNSEWLELMSRIHSNRGNYDEATHILEKLIDLNPFVSRYWNMLAMMQLCCNKYDECLNSAEYSLAVTPGNTDGLWCKAKALFGQGNAEEALTFYDKFLQHIPNCARAEADMGSCHLQLGNSDEALRYLKQAEQDCKDDVSLLAQICDDLAFTYSSINEVEKALYYIDKAEELNRQTGDDILDSDSQRMVLKGHIYMQNNQREKGISLFDHAIAKSGQDPEIIFKVIASVYDQNLHDMVIKYFKLLETVIPEGWTLGYAYMAASLIKTSNLKEGLTYLKKASKINPHEVELIFGYMFPPEITRDQYFDYLKHFNIE